MDDIEFEIAQLKRERNAVILAAWRVRLPGSDSGLVQPVRVGVGLSSLFMTFRSVSSARSGR